MPRTKKADSKPSSVKPQKAIQTEPTEIVREKTYVIDTAKMSRRSSKLDPEPASVYDAAANLVRAEKLSYEQSTMGIKETTKRAFKNYLGIFDEPYDPYTGRKKIFTHLTHNIVDSVAKPVDIEANAIHIEPLTNESRGKAKVLNMILPYFLQQMGFDELMRNITHRTAWLGAQVTCQDWYYEEMEVPNDKAEATIKQLRGFAYKQKVGDKTRIVITDRPRVRSVNIMDIFLPGTAESIPWAVKNASVIVRSPMTVAEVQGNPLYDDNVKASLVGRTWEPLDRFDSSSLNMYSLAGFTSGETKTLRGGEFPRSENPMVTIYERYGMIPKSWITGDVNDSLLLVPGIITCVSETNGGDMKTLCVRMSPFGDYGPFEEVHFNKIPNRWQGEGLGERLIPLQVWHNEIVNNRRNNEILVQHRMFIYRKGKVDPRQFTSRPGGGIAVENMDDVQALMMPDVSASSFNEDASIEGAAQRLAGAATTPIQKKATATEVQNIQANANLTYNELRGTMERYLERLVLKHIIPLMRRYFSGEVTIPIELPMKELEMLDSFNGYAPFMTEKIGKERFLLVDEGSLFDGDFAVTCDIEATNTNRGAQAAALTSAIAMASKVQDSGLNIPFAIRKQLELQGLVDDRLFQDAKPATPTGVTNPNMVNPQGPMMGQPGAMSMMGATMGAPGGGA